MYFYVGISFLSGLAVLFFMAGLNVIGGKVYLGL
jgi:hypothetical protein